MLGRVWADAGDRRCGDRQCAQVKTTAGLVEGVSADEGRVRVFKGLPYAAPPVGALRWKAPAPVAPWTGVRKADAFGAQCMQPPVFADIVFDRPASEDCLYLNLWTPATDAAARLPVMVWIHGGGYQAGASHEPRHDGVRLARNGVVLITINYRLGVFGFFAHPALVEGRPAREFGQLRRCSTWWRRCSGYATTSRHSAATPATSRSSASRRGRSPSTP